MLREKFTLVNAYIRKEKILQINNQSFYLRKPEKEEQDKYKASRRKEMLKKIQKSKKIRMKQKGFFKKSINLIKL